MPFRDDDEAARARADALQVDLDRTNEKLERAEDETEAAQRELAATKARLARAEAKLAERGEEVPPPPPTPAPSHPVPLGGKLLILAGTMGLAILLLVALKTGAPSSSSPSGSGDVPNPSCTLRTDPPGAQIVSLCRDSVSEAYNAHLLDAGSFPLFPETFETVRGTTPLTQDRLTWIAWGVICNGTMVARLAGYRDTPVSSPTEGMGCSDRVIPLEK